MTFVDYAEFIWNQDCAQQETANILGWSEAKVKQYSALRKVTDLAWSAVVTFINALLKNNGGTVITATLPVRPAPSVLGMLRVNQLARHGITGGSTTSTVETEKLSPQNRNHSFYL